MRKTTKSYENFGIEMFHKLLKVMCRAHSAAEEVCASVSEAHLESFGLPELFNDSFEHFRREAFDLSDRNVETKNSRRILNLMAAPLEYVQKCGFKC